MQSIAGITVLVPDYEEAIAYYTGKLGFILLEDTDLGAGKRWVRVAPPNAGSWLLLAKAVNAVQLGAIGNQAGGRVFLFLETDDFDRDYAAYQERGVRFSEPPREESYGKVAVFTDLYGNRWDLIERRNKKPR